MWWLLSTYALAQSTPVWEASAHVAVWSVPFETTRSVDMFEPLPTRNAGLQLAWRPRDVMSSPELFVRGSLWRDYDVQERAAVVPKNEGNLMVGAGWRHVQPIRGPWSFDVGASVAGGLSTKDDEWSYTTSRVISPCVNAGLWGQNVRVGVRGCGSTGNEREHAHDEVWSTPEPTGLRLVVGAKLHTRREHSAL